MTMTARRALVGAALLLALVVVPAATTSAANDQTSTCEFTICSFTTPNPTTGITNDGVFVASFEHPSNVTYANIRIQTTSTAPPGCATPPFVDDPSPAQTTQQPRSTTVSHPLALAFQCNGTYDMQAVANQAHVDCTATPTPPAPACLEIDWTGVTVAIPAPPPRDVNATANSDGSITVTWNSGYDTAPPPDFVGFSVWRIDANGKATMVKSLAATATSYTDVDMTGPAPYTYRVDAARQTWVPVSSATTPSGVTPITQPGASSTTATTAASTPATAVFDPPTLAGDEPGVNEPPSIPADPTAPRASTTQRFSGSGRPGEGLVKPFATALVLGVWAALFLFLSRRAARLDPHARPIEVEHLT